MDIELDKYYQSKKVCKMQTIHDIIEYYETSKKFVDLFEVVLLSIEWGSIYKVWFKKHPKGEIWWYYDILPLSGSSGFLMIEDDKIVELKKVYVS